MAVYLGSNKISNGDLGVNQINDLYVGTNPAFLIDLYSNPTVEQFITNTGITGTTAAAVRQLGQDLVFNGLWNKMIAFWPLAGSTADSFKYNLINPVDSNAAFRLTYTGSVGFGPGGMTGSVTGLANANTYWNPNLYTGTLITGSFSFGAYTVNNSGSDTNCDMGIDVESGPTGRFAFGLYGQGSSPRGINWVADAVVQASTTSSAGFWVDSRTATNVHKLYKNGAQIGSTDTSNISSGTFASSINLRLMAQAFGAGIADYSPRTYGTFFIGYGLTDSNVYTLNNIIHTYNTTLGRPYQ